MADQRPVPGRPLMLICETTNICNNHCIICAYDHQTRKKQRMQQDVFRRTLEQYVEIGGGPLSLTPMVGDVFLDRSQKRNSTLLPPTAL
jgi:hypothetical protein